VERLCCSAAGVPHRQTQPASRSPGREGTATWVTQTPSCPPPPPRTARSASRGMQRATEGSQVRGARPQDNFTVAFHDSSRVGCLQAQQEFTDHAAGHGEVAKRARGVGRGEQGVQHAVLGGTGQAKTPGTTAVTLRHLLCEHQPVCSQQWGEKHSHGSKGLGLGQKNMGEEPE